MSKPIDSAVVLCVASIAGSVGIASLAAMATDRSTGSSAVRVGDLQERAEVRSEAKLNYESLRSSVRPESFVTPPPDGVEMAGQGEPVGACCIEASDACLPDLTFEECVFLNGGVWYEGIGCDEVECTPPTPLGASGRFRVHRR